MRELGARIQQARMEQGKTLSQMHEVTKIRLSYLEAIEAGDWSVLPGGFYAKMFVKTYAEALGLPATELLNQAKPYLVSHESNLPNPITRTPEQSSWQIRLQRFAPAILGWSLAFILLLSIYSWLSGKEANPAENPTVSPDRISNMGEKQLAESWDMATSTPEAVPTNTLLQMLSEQSPEPNSTVTTESSGTYTYVGDLASDSDTSSGTMESFESVKGVEGYVLSGVPQLNLKLSIRGDASWIEVREDSKRGSKIKLGKDVFERGEVIDLKSVKVLYIKLGNPSAVDMSVNGSMLDTGTEQKPRTFAFNLSGMNQ